MVERETIELTVDSLSKDGKWKNGTPVTVMEDPSGKERKVTVVLKVKDCNSLAPRQCYNCSSDLSDDDLIIHTETGWVIPCRVCKMFAWYKEEDEHYAGG